MISCSYVLITAVRGKGLLKLVCVIIVVVFKLLELALFFV